MTLTELRKNIYSVVEEVLSTGKTIEITAKGRIVLLSPGHQKSKMERLRTSARKRAITCNPDDLISINWEKEWEPKHI